MDTIINVLTEITGPTRIKQNEPLISHTTFKTGGPADVYIETENKEELIALVKVCKKNNVAVHILGGGSNMVVTQAGIRGVVIKNNCRKFELVGMVGRVKNSQIGVDKARVYVESGVIMNQLVRFTIDHGLSGLEDQLGLPGSVGGAIVMNACYQKENKFTGENLYSAELLNTDTMQVREVDKEYFKFGFDTSIIQQTKEIVLSCVFTLIPGDKDELWKKATDALTYRTSTQPKNGTGYTYRNISQQGLNKANIEDIIVLMQRSEVLGAQVNDAHLFAQHPNFIINQAKATSQDFEQLIKKVKDEVLRVCGVNLHFEAKIVGN